MLWAFSSDLERGSYQMKCKQEYSVDSQLTVYLESGTCPQSCLQTLSLFVRVPTYYRLQLPHKLRMPLPDTYPILEPLKFVQVYI